MKVRQLRHDFKYGANIFGLAETKNGAEHAAAYEVGLFPTWVKGDVKREKELAPQLRARAILTNRPRFDIIFSVLDNHLQEFVRCLQS